MRKIIYCCSAALLLCALIFAKAANWKEPVTSTPSQPIETVDLVWEFGRLGQDNIASKNPSIAVQGNTIQIRKDELELIAGRRQLTNDPDAVENALKYLLRREALYNLALQANVQVTDDEVYALIEQMKEDFSNLTDYTEYADAFIEGLGMTWDEYWDTQYDLLCKEIYIDKYLQQVVFEKYGNNEFAFWDTKQRQEWEALKDQLAQDYINQDNIRYLNIPQY